MWQVATVDVKRDPRARSDPRREEQSKTTEVSVCHEPLHEVLLHLLEPASASMPRHAASQASSPLDHRCRYNPQFHPNCQCIM